MCKRYEWCDVAANLPRNVQVLYPRILYANCLSLRCLALCDTHDYLHKLVNCTLLQITNRGRKFRSFCRTILCFGKSCWSSKRTSATHRVSSTKCIFVFLLFPRNHVHH